MIPKLTFNSIFKDQRRYTRPPAGEFMRKAALKAGLDITTCTSERSKDVAQWELKRAEMNCEIIKARATIKTMMRMREKL